MMSAPLRMQVVRRIDKPSLRYEIAFHDGNAFVGALTVTPEVGEKFARAIEAGEAVAQVDVPIEVDTALEVGKTWPRRA